MDTAFWRVGQIHELSFEFFLVCLQKCAKALFSGPGWDGSFPTDDDKIRLLLFWMDQPQKLFSGNSGKLLERMVGSATPSLALRAGIGNAAGTPRAGTGGGVDSTASSALAEAALEAAAARVPAGSGVAYSLAAGVVTDGTRLAASTTFVAPGAKKGLVARNAQMQLLPHSLMMDAELMRLFRHYCSGERGLVFRPVAASVLNHTIPLTSIRSTVAPPLMKMSKRAATQRKGTTGRNLGILGTLTQKRTASA